MKVSSPNFERMVSSKRSLLAAATFLAHTIGIQAATWDGTRFAWYTSDAGSTFANSLPIGNGRIGATVYGTPVEKLVLNENSMWSGPFTDRANANSKNALADIRQKLQSGSITAAGESALNNMAGNPTSPRAYNPLVNMALDFGHSSGISSYNRWLDTYQGTAGVNYTWSGVTYSREYVPSYPHGVLAVRLGASQSGKINVKVSLSRSQSVLSQTASTGQGNGGSHSVVLNGNSGQSSGAITFWSEARILNSGGMYHVVYPWTVRLYLTNSR